MGGFQIEPFRLQQSNLSNMVIQANQIKQAQRQFKAEAQQRQIKFQQQEFKNGLERMKTFGAIFGAVIPEDPESYANAINQVTTAFGQKEADRILEQLPKDRDRISADDSKRIKTQFRGFIGDLEKKQEEFGKVQAVTGPGGEQVFAQFNKNTREFETVGGATPKSTAKELQGKEPSFDDLIKFQNTVQNNPIVKEFSLVDTQSKRLNTAVQDVKNQRKAGNKFPDFIAVDQALITVYNKMLDPTSVVRESEYARTPNDQALMSQIKGQGIRAFMGGAGLTDTNRNAIVRMANGFAKIAKRKLEPEVNRFKKIAKRFNFDEDLVISPLITNLQDQQANLFGDQPELSNQEITNTFNFSATGQRIK